MTKAQTDVRNLSYIYHMSLSLVGKAASRTLGVPLPGYGSRSDRVPLIRYSRDMEESFGVSFEYKPRDSSKDTDSLLNFAEFSHSQPQTSSTNPGSDATSNGSNSLTDPQGASSRPTSSLTDSQGASSRPTSGHDINRHSQFYIPAGPLPDVADSDTDSDVLT